MTACSMCARKGILIYPVRYAVACPRGAVEVPALSGNFKIENAPADISRAKFTLRSMRPGYMYAYDEKRKRLKAYMVLPSGVLQSFPLEHEPASPKVDRVSNCANPDELTFMRCIDVVHRAGDEATNVWVGWSSVVWTKALILKIDDRAWRIKHMQCFNVPALIAGKAAHSAEFAGHHKQIAHFSADKVAMKRAFGFSNTPVDDEVRYSGLASQISATMAAHAPYNKGFIVAVNDPVGIVNDLSELTLPSIDAGFDEDIARGMMVYDMLAIAEKSLREDARRSVTKADASASASLQNPDIPNATDSLWQMLKLGATKAEARAKADRKIYGSSLANRQNAAADHAWEDVISEEKDGKRVALLDSERIKRFPTVYEEAIRKFLPCGEQLIRAHAEWLASEQLASWMEGVHDTKDIRSGYAYSESLAQCIGKGVASKPCSDLLINWLKKGAPSDPRNLYTRALLFNHADLIKATEAGLKGSDVQYENVLNIYKMTLISLDGDAASKLMDRLALGTANIIVGALKGTAYSVMKYIATLHLVLITGKNITTTAISVSELAEWALTQARLSDNSFVEFGEHRLAALRHAAAVVGNDDPKLFVFGLSEEFSSNNGRAGGYTLVRQKIPGLDQAKKWLGSSAPQTFHLGVATMIVQMLAITFVAEDMVKADKFNSQERSVKGFASIIGLAATLVDLVASTAEVAPRHPIATFLKQQWANNPEAMRMLGKGARYVGLIAGILAGAYDLINMANAWEDGKMFLSFLYGNNSVLGIAVAIAGFSSSLLFWPLLVLSIIIGLAIAYFSSGALQEWMSRCYFSVAVSRVRAVSGGKPPFGPYPYSAADAECKAFKSAMGV